MTVTAGADHAVQPQEQRPSPDLAFLGVDAFLRTLVDARALKTAFELGLVDHLRVHRGASFEAVGRALAIDRAGLRLLVDLLVANGVLGEKALRLRLTPRFEAALAFRDLLETKLDFAGLALGDFADHFTGMVRDPADKASRGRLLDLFDYRRALDPTPGNYARTRTWMRLTSSLTRHEAQVAWDLHDLSPHERMLDVGGNSGEFALQACRRHAGLQATVFDLPLVCEIGLEHVLPEPEGSRIAFRAGDVRREPLPPGHDLVTFKSMLHDWPEEDAGRFLEKAVDALAPGGTLLVFERSGLGSGSPAFSLLPILLFFRAYRGPEGYTARLRALGMEDIRVQQLALDTPFFLLTARKPAPRAHG
jgi:SAM-dependent methyltransferase